MTALRQLHLNGRSILTRGSQVSHTLAAQTAHHVATGPNKDQKTQTKQKYWTSFIKLWMSQMFLEQPWASRYGVHPQNSSPAKSAVCMRALCLHSLTACRSNEISFQLSQSCRHFSGATMRLTWATYCSDYGNNLTAWERRRRLETMTCVLVRGKGCRSCWLSSWQPQPKTHVWEHFWLVLSSKLVWTELQCFLQRLFFRSC